MPSQQVTFFYPYPEELAHLEEIELDETEYWSEEGLERRRAWVVQTYLRLHRAGHPVSISETLPTEGILVLLPETDILSSFRNQYGPEHQGLLLVTIRADIIGFQSPLGDADIVQNGRFADESRTFFIPHWPQPGLLPRDPSRGTTIENIVFKGGFGSLHADFRSERWNRFLDERGLRFHISSAETEGKVPAWHDYTTADLNLAVRPPHNDGGLYYGKPASKLMNAWHAGVPSLLGPEYAYRELRSSPLDYIEVQSVDEAMTAIDRLLEDPSLYEQMVKRALERASEFTPEKITERWAEVLFSRLPEIQKTPSFQWTRWMPLEARRPLNVLLMPPAPFELRKQMGYLYRRYVSDISILSSTNGRSIGPKEEQTTAGAQLDDEVDA